MTRLMPPYLSATLACLIGLGLASCSQKNPAPESAADREVESFLTDVDAAKAGELIAADKAVVVIDVRTPEEYADGHLAGAVNVNFKNENFKEELAKLDRDKTYVMHCRSGGRSTAAKPAFTELGFKYIYHLDGGYLAWEEAGQAIEK